MAKQKVKMYRNGPGGRWTHRITWYEDNIAIRLKEDMFRTKEGVQNFTFEGPLRKQWADEHWQAFKEKYPFVQPTRR